MTTSATPLLISESLGWRLHQEGDECVTLGVHLEHLNGLSVRDGWLHLELPRELLNAVTREWHNHRIRAEPQHAHADLLELLILQVAGIYRLKMGKVLHDRAGQTPLRARHVIWYLARKHARLSYPEIARPFGMDHTSVLKAVRKITGLLQAGDVAWTQTIRAIEERLSLPHEGPSGTLPLPAGITEVAVEDRDTAALDGEE